MLGKEEKIMIEHIDYRNQELWNLLSKQFEITIENSLNEEYSCITKNSKAIIYIVPNNKSINSFTHELLHIYLKYKEFYVGNSIKLLISQDNILSILLSENLLEHIGNCLDHLKMIEIYNNLGFDKAEFLLDFNTFKCNNEELNNLKHSFKYLDKINLSTIDFYIGKLIAMLCDPNENNDYSNELHEFRNLDLELYEIIILLVEETKKFDVEKNDLLNSYSDISFEFYKNLKSWIIKQIN